jgi:hypothetical protein
MAAYRPLAAAAAGAGGTAGTCRGAVAASAAAAANGILGVDHEPVVGHVDLDIAGLGFEFLVYDEGETGSFVSDVFIVRLIQSQGQARACSATGREVHADGGRFFIGKIAFQLFLGGFGYFKHIIPPNCGREKKR